MMPSMTTHSFAHSADAYTKACQPVTALGVRVASRAGSALFQRVAPVDVLLLVSRPAAVVWRVVATAVNAIYRVPQGWLATHIGNKGREAVPFSANAYALASILWPSASIRILATLQHGIPCSILWPCPVVRLINRANRDMQGAWVAMPTPASVMHPTPRASVEWLVATVDRASHAHSITESKR